MDHEIEIKFQQLKTSLEKDFGPGLDVPALLFLIGVNELGIGHKTFSKQEKTELMHIAICTLLEPYGYYEFEGRDKDSWPHFKVNQLIPVLGHQEQQHLMKEAMIEYFIQNDYYTPIDEQHTS